MSFILENDLQTQHFFFFFFCKNGEMDTYGTTGELKKRAFKAVKRMRNNQLAYK